MYFSRLVLLIVSSSLLLLVLLPSTSSSPGHYVHDYYKKGPEQGRSPRHLNSGSSALWSPGSVFAALLLAAAAQIGRHFGRM